MADGPHQVAVGHIVRDRNILKFRLGHRRSIDQGKTTALAFPVNIVGYLSWQRLPVDQEGNGRPGERHLAVTCLGLQFLERLGQDIPDMGEDGRGRPR